MALAHIEQSSESPHLDDGEAFFEQEKQPIAVINALKVTRGGQEVLAIDEPLEINTGLTLVTGPSGSGKSTLMDAALGFIEADECDIEWQDRLQREPDEGRFLLGGLRALLKGSDTRKLDIAHVEQDIVFDKGRTVIDQIVSDVELKGREVDFQKCLELAEVLGITDQLAKYPANMSGGQRARIAILRAFAEGTAVVFMDEPTAAVDPEKTDSIFAELRQIADLNPEMAIVVITHDTAHQTHANSVIELGARGVDNNQYDPNEKTQPIVLSAVK